MNHVEHLIEVHNFPREFVESMYEMDEAIVLGFHMADHQVALHKYPSHDHEWWTEEGMEHG